IELKNRGAAMHADYVQIYTVTEPHSETGCYDNKFVIRGTAFKAARATVPAAKAADSDSAETAPKAAPASSCDPPCSPGFACKAGACEPVCNPACEKGETCTRKRICEPTPAGA
ncbi:MAG TPA: hypothetical protein VI319_06365, partial [Burkholderiales bacterium]